ncbi:MAG: WD40 repeat domain-containing protein [Acidobacteriota bacterium]
MKDVFITILMAVSALSTYTSAQKVEFRHGKGRFAAICFSPNSQEIITASFGNDGFIRGWNVKTGREIWDIDLHRSDDLSVYDFVDVFSMDVSSDGQKVAVGFDRSSRKSSGTITKPENLIQIYEIATRKLLITLRGHTDLIGSISFSPNGKNLASVDSDGKLMTWNTETGERLLSWSIINRGRSVKFSPDGTVIAAMSVDASLGKTEDTGIGLFDAKSGKLIRQIPRPLFSGGKVEFSPDGRFLATTTNGYRIAVTFERADRGEVSISLTGTDTKEGAVEIWDLRKSFEQPYAVFLARLADPVAFSGTGLLAFAYREGGKGKVVVRNIENRQIVRVFDVIDDISALDISSDNRSLAVGGGSGAIYLFDLPVSSPVNETFLK